MIDEHEYMIYTQRWKEKTRQELENIRKTLISKIDSLDITNNTVKRSMINVLDMLNRYIETKDSK